MKRTTRLLLIAILILAGIYFFPTWIFEKPPPARQEVPAGHAGDESLLSAFGTHPGVYHLPDKAIDASTIPNIILRKSDNDDDPLPYFRIAPDTYLFYGNIALVDTLNRAFTANAGFVITDDSVVVIDTLGTPRLGRRMIATIRTVTDKPVSHLVLTHCHPDHCFGASAFRRLGGVRVIAATTGAELTATADAAARAQKRYALLPDDMEGFGVVQPDIPVLAGHDEDMIIRTGGKTFEIYNAGTRYPVETLLVYQVEDDIVWASDLVSSQRLPILGDADSNDILDGLDWLQASFSGAEIMVPGHGSAQRPPFPMIERNRAYLQQLQEFMERSVAEGLSEAEAVERADFREWQDLPLFRLEHPVNAGRVYREMVQ